MSRRFWKTLLRECTAHQDVLSRKRRATAMPQVELLEDLTLPSANIIMQPTLVLDSTLQMAHNPTVRPQTGPPTNPYTNSLTPAEVRSAYSINGINFNGITGDGSGQTIAIVDAYDDPNIASDLADFDTYYSIPNAPTFSFNKIYASGSQPAANQGWAQEITLDVEWAHVVAPGAKIDLVEAASASLSALLTAVNVASTQTGASVVSMSWGSSEFSGEASDDSYFSTSGVTYFGSSGDSGSPAIWPALSSHVVATGGTSLTLSNGAYGSEAGWSGSGGSLSTVIAAPSYQSGLAISNGSATISASGKRAGPDVAYDADPNTGVAVYSPYAFGTSEGGWEQIGGTSAAAPQWAALMSIVNQGRVLAGGTAMSGYSQTLPALYQLPSSDFHDVTTGSNGGYSAGPGFDLVTGRGTPIASSLVPALAGYGSGTGAQPPTITTAAHVVANSANAADTTVMLNVGATDNDGGTLTYTWAPVTNTPSTVSFSPNGTSAGSTTTATFTQANSYTFQVTVTDPTSGLSTVSTVSTPYTVSQVLTSITVSPSTATVADGGTKQFAASGHDQFGVAMTTPPSFTWSVASGGIGGVSGSGLYTAPTTGTGTATVVATSGSLSGSATVTVTAAPTGPQITQAAYIVSQTPTSANLAVAATDANYAASSLTYTWTVTGTPPAAVTFSPNGTSAAAQTTAHFTALGTYNLLVTVTDPGSLSTTSAVTVTVSQVATTITLAPGTASVSTGATQQFTPTVKDQFGGTLASPPALTWTTTAGTVSTSGLFTAPATAGSAVVTASYTPTGGSTISGQATVTITGSTSGLLFSDNFANGASQWTVESGSYYLATMSNGTRGLLVVNQGGVSRITAGSTSWTNYSLQGTITLEANYGGGSVSLMARVADVNHFYFFGYSVSYGAWFIARKDGSNVTTMLAVGPSFAAHHGQGYVVSANVVGSSLTLLVNGVQQVSVTDATYASGAIGFTATNAEGLLGSVTVNTDSGSNHAMATDLSSSHTAASTLPPLPFQSFTAAASAPVYFLTVPSGFTVGGESWLQLEAAVAESFWNNLLG